jgi:hypothetical protein
LRISTVIRRTTVTALVSTVCLGIAVVDAQETPQSPPARPVTETAERIARQLWPVEVDQGSLDEQGRPRFRTSVEASPIVLPLPWQNDPAGGPVQPRSRLYHAEFLSVVTPEPFRASALTAAAGGGVGVDPGAMFDGVKSVWREWQTRRVRERIERELAELQAANSESSR